MALFYYFYVVNMTVTALDYEFYLADYWMKKETEIIFRHIF